MGSTYNLCVSATTGSGPLGIDRSSSDATGPGGTYHTSGRVQRPVKQERGGQTCRETLTKDTHVRPQRGKKGTSPLRVGEEGGFPSVPRIDDGGKVEGRGHEGPDQEMVRRGGRG